MRNKKIQKQSHKILSSGDIVTSLEQKMEK